MTYILIVLWGSFLQASAGGGKAALSVEFKDAQSCQAALTEILRQQKPGSPVSTILCAPKEQAR